jgi:hypothetical protein
LFLLFQTVIRDAPQAMPVSDLIVKGDAHVSHFFQMQDARKETWAFFCLSR